MLTLKTKNGTVEPAFNYLMYKNISGDDKEKRNSKFNSFLDDLFSDDVDSIITFFKAVAGKDLGEDELADQLEDDGRFDDVHATTTEIIEGLVNSGFLNAKIEMWEKSAEKFIKSMKDSLKMDSLKQSEKDMAQIQVNQLEENKKAIDKRLKAAKK